MSPKTGAILRIIAIILVGLTAAFTLLGGVGTTCVAFNAEKYGRAFATFVPYKPTYQIFVYVSLAAGIAGLAAAFAMVRGYKWAYWGALITVLVSLVVAAVHMYYSSTLKGVSFFATPPENMRFYAAVITLLFLLLLRLPGIWQWANFTLPWRGRGSASAAGGLTAFVAGVITITTPLWAGAPHMLDGYNLVNVLQVPLTVVGWGLVLAGLSLLVLPVLRLPSPQAAWEKATT
jgi:hypothetical protein